MSTGFELKKGASAFRQQILLKKWSTDQTHIVPRDYTQVFMPKLEQIAVSKYAYRVEGLSQDQKNLLLAELGKINSPIASLLVTLIEQCAELGDKIHIEGKYGRIVIDIFKSNVVENVYVLTEDMIQDSYELIVNGGAGG